MANKNRAFKISATIVAAPEHFYPHVRQIAATLDAIRGQAIDAAQDKPSPGTTLEI